MNEKYLKTYREYLKLSCSGDTIRHYSRILNKYLNTVKNPKEAAYGDVLAFINTYNSQSSKKQAQGALMHFYKGVIYNPNLIVRLPKIKTEQAIPETLTELEAETLINSIKNIKQRAIIATLYYGALRISEVTNLHINHIDGKKNELHIKFSKGAKSRLVPVPDHLIELLRRYYKIYKPNGYLFQGQKKPRYSHESIRSILKRALLSNKIRKTITPHCLRHSRATHLLAHGVDIKILKEYLGHKNIETTERYLHLTTNNIRDAIIKADSKITNKPQL